MKTALLKIEKSCQVLTSYIGKSHEHCMFVLCLHFQVDQSIINLTVGQHHGLVILIHGGAAHGAHQAALAAVSRGKAEGQTV